MAISVCGLFKIGIGPSSSPTVGAPRDTGAARHAKDEETSRGGLAVSAIER